MKRWFGPLLLGCALAVAAHAAVIWALPRGLMHTAMERIGRDGMINAWRHGRRVTPQSRAVVRPSPDIAYSSCVYDLGHGPVRIHVQPSPGYWSLSLYAANSDNFRVWNDHDSPRGVDVLLLAADMPTPDVPAGAAAVRSPSRRGIALIRRLAADDAAWRGIDDIRKQDACAENH